ncbi:Stemmadenine O-acetyltransferase [Linum perenne]
MEVTVISIENIKPYSATTKWQPFKLSMLDQLAPSSYSPLIYFYPSKPNSPANDVHRTLASSILKASLSKTLDLFYPLSGRENDDKLFIHDFESGVPFIETRIHGQTIAEFLQPPKLEFLNKLLPFEPVCVQPRNGPQVAVQLNTFDCGGIAIGLSFFHRIIDGATFSAFLKTWSAFANQNPDSKTDTGLVNPDFVSGSSVFPPSDSIPADVQSFMDKLYFRETSVLPRSTSRRFVFHNDAISALKSTARSDKVPNPSRIETLTAFIWKSVMQAAAESESPDNQYLECMRQAVDMRSRMGERLSRNSVGNLVAGAMVSCNKEDSVKDLVEKIRIGVKGIDENFLNGLSSGVQLHGNDFLPVITSGGEIIQKALGYSSWSGFGVNDFDFGLGIPVWTGVLGDHIGNEAAFKNAVIFKEVGATGSVNNSGMEAWVKFDEQVMAVLERDPDFLEFASPNPSIVFN